MDNIALVEIKCHVGLWCVLRIRCCLRWWTGLCILAFDKILQKLRQYIFICLYSATLFYRWPVAKHIVQQLIHILKEGFSARISRLFPQHDLFIEPPSLFINSKMFSSLSIIWVFKYLNLSPNEIVNKIIIKYLSIVWNFQHLNVTL